MPVLLCLNERSCGHRLPERDVGAAMVQFVRAVSAVRPQAVLVTPYKLPGIDLADGYPMSRWIAENRDGWRKLRSLQNRAPYSYAELADERDADVEYRFEGDTALGLGLAHSHDGLAVSLPTAPRWHASVVPLNRTAVDETAGEVVEDDVDVRHLSSSDHVVAHENWLDSIAFGATIVSGVELWDRRGELFPALTFLPRVEAQLIGLDPKWVHAVTVRLRECQEMVVEWRAGDAIQPRYRSFVTPEYATRRRATQFEDLDGVVRDFGTHLRFTPDPGRLHLREVPEERTIRIAHIGRKIEA